MNTWLNGEDGIFEGGNLLMIVAAVVGVCAGFVKWLTNNFGMLYLLLVWLTHMAWKTPTTAGKVCEMAHQQFWHVVFVVGVANAHGLENTNNGGIL